MGSTKRTYGAYSKDNFSVRASAKRRRYSSPMPSIAAVETISPMDAKIAKAEKVARQALRLARKNKVTTEVKQHDVASGSLSPSNSASIVELTTGARAIPVGDSYFERIGDQVFGKVMFFNLKINWNPTPTTQLLKIAFVRGHNEDNTIVNANDVYQTNAIESQRTYHDRKKVTILWERVFILNRDTGVASNKHFENITVPLNFNMNYTSDGTSPEDSHIYMYAVSDQAADFPTIDYSMRLLYSDP